MQVKPVFTQVSTGFFVRSHRRWKKLAVIAQSV